MSHNKNYGSYYKKEEPIAQRKEAPAIEETVEEVQKEEPKVEEIKPEPEKKVKVYASVIGGKPCKMRFKPDQRKGQVINIIPHKAKVTVLEENGTWWKVSYKGITGYMMSQFLKKE